MSESENTNKYQEFMKAASEATDQSRGVLLSYFGNLSQVSEKFQAGLVSEADTKSEEIIVQHLKKKYPSHSILGEESGLNSSEDSTHTWYIDPLDGTTNYVHRFPIYCTSIGLEENGELVAAVIDVPMLDQRFQAYKGGGAWLGDERLQVSRRKELKDLLIGTGFSVENDDQVEQQMRVIDYFVRNTRGIRRAGAAAYDLCMVAMGAYDGFWEMSLSPWDTAAGTLLVKEAGGVVTDFKGQDYHPNKRDIVAGSPDIHPLVLGRVQSVVG